MGMALHLFKFDSPSPKDPLCQVWLKSAEWFWRSSNFVNVFSLFRKYLPLEKGGALHLIKLESPLPKHALCQVWLKLAQWFWRRRWKCESLQQLRQRRRRRTTHILWSEKLTWVFSSGELKMSTTQDINVIHTRYQRHPHKISISFMQFINVIHTRYEFHSHMLFMPSTQHICQTSIQNINAICIRYLSSSNQDTDLVSTRSCLGRSLGTSTACPLGPGHPPRLAPPSPYNPTTDTRHSGNKAITQAGLIYLYM